MDSRVNFGLLVVAAIIGWLILDPMLGDLQTAAWQRIQAVTGISVSPVVTFIVSNMFGFIALGAMFYGAYWLGKYERQTVPLFVLEGFATGDNNGWRELLLVVTNKGEFFDKHLVKVERIQNQNDGADVDSSRLPKALRTAQQRENNRSGRFNLGQGETKKVLLGRSHLTGSESPVIEYEDGSVTVLDEKLGVYLVSLSLHGNTTLRTAVKLRIDLNRDMSHSPVSRSR